MRTASLDRSSFVCQSEALTDTYIAKKKDNHFKKLQHDAQQAQDCQQAVDELHRAPPGLAGAGRDSRVAADQLASDVENLADIYAFGGQKSAACAEQNLARLRDGYRRRKGGSSSVDARVAAAAALSGGLPPPPPDATVPARERLGPLKALIKAGTEHAATHGALVSATFASLRSACAGPPPRQGAVWRSMAWCPRWIWTAVRVTVNLWRAGCGTRRRRSWRTHLRRSLVHPTSNFTPSYAESCRRKASLGRWLFWEAFLLGV